MELHTLTQVARSYSLLMVYIAIWIGTCCHSNKTFILHSRSTGRSWKLHNRQNGQCCEIMVHIIHQIR